MRILQLSVLLIKVDHPEDEEEKVLAARQDIQIDLDKVSGTPHEVLMSAISTFDLDGLYEAAISKDGTMEFPLDGETEH